MAEIKGRISRVRFKNSDNGYFVADYNDKSTGLGAVIVGTARFIGPGVEFSAEGEWVKHPKFGPQFSARVFTPGNGNESPELAAIRAMLASGFVKGIRDSIADDFVKLHGENSLAVLDKALNGDTEDLRLVPGMGKVTSKWAVDSWRERGHTAKATLLAIRAGLSPKETKRALDLFGKSGLQETILEHPYRLTLVRGITWATADKIAKEAWPGKTPIAHDSPQRYCAAAREILRTEGTEDGHTALPADLVFAKAAELATPSNGIGEFSAAIQSAADTDGLVFVQSDGETMMADKGVYTIEEESAVQLVKMLKKAPKPIAPWDEARQLIPRYSGVELSPDQEEAIRLALESGVVVITGGPGTGKTTTMRTLCAIAEYYGHGVTLCAPTGKAADRMRKATGRPAGTIHRTLGVRDGKSLYTFTSSVVIVDEASMMDYELFNVVLQACTPGRTRLVLVGDVDQLPPVGGGEPFYQVITSGAVPVARLSIIHRQGEDSGIIALAHGINRGQFEFGGYPNAVISRVSANDELREAAMQVYDQLVTGFGIDSIRLATPVNKYAYGQAELNAALQERYNRSPRVSALHPFRVGDHVIHVKNVYNMHEQVVFNGMTGKVTTVRPDSLLADRDMWDDKEEPWLVAVQYDDDEIVYRKEEIEAYLRLAYCLTIHKLQGDESPHVVMLTPKTWHGFMMRQLVYTGATRAKETLHVISTGNALEVCATNEARWRRYTLLGSLINERMEQHVSTVAG